jgi:hypothetical protein
MTKMPKMQNISNLLLFGDRDDQLAYFILPTPLEFSEVGLVIIGLAASPSIEHFCQLLVREKIVIKSWKFNYHFSV